MADIDRKSSAFVDQNHGKKLKVTDVLGSDLIRVEGSDRNIRLIGLVAFERFGKDAVLGRVPHPLAPDYPNQKDQTSLQFATKNLKGVTVTIHSPRREVFTGEVLPGKDLPLQEKDGSLGAIVYLSSGESWQEFIVRNGYAYYDNHLESTLTKVLPLQGMKSSGTERVSNPGKNYARILYDAEREARIGSLEGDTPGTPKGIWQEKYASGPGHAALENFIQAWGKQSKIVTLFDRNNYPSSTYLPPRYQTKGSPEKAKKLAARRQARLFNATTRDYSETPIGAELRKQAEKYFPEATSLDIIKKIVSGGHETSITQIGALWCGIPTAQQESLSLPTTAHVASISEMRKDGDVQTILGQGFIQSAMGDRPPYEGITMTLIVEPDGVETFLVPLFTQCRMDPIIPVRNLYLSRFARPLMSYKPFYSDIFGALPAFLQNDNAKTVQPDELQLLNYLYLSVPVYIAVAQIQVENYTTTAGSFVVTINGNITDVSTTYGKYPVYAKTIEQSFQLQRQRVTMADRLNTRQMIQETAQELALTPISVPINAKTSTDAFNEINTALAKNYKSIGTVTLLAKDGKLMRIPEAITARDIQRQLRKPKQVIRGQDTKLTVDNYLHYRAASGPKENKGFLRSIGILGPSLPPGPQTGNDIVAALIRTRGFPLPNAASFLSRAEIKDPSILGTESDPKKNNNIGFLTGVAEVEWAFTTNNSSDIPRGIRTKEELFNKTNNYTAYPAGFKNIQEETVLGFDGAQIMEPFELVMTNPAENGPGSVLTNLDLEFVCSYGIPVLSLTKEGSSFRTKLITVSNGNQATPQMLNASIEGNIEQRGTRVSIISKKQTGNGGDTNPTFNAYYDALKASVQNNSVVFVPELTSSAMYKSSADDPEFATIKYSDYASFPMRVSDVGKTNADTVAVGTTFKMPVPAAKSSGGVGLLSSGQSFTKQKRQSMVQPVEVWTFQTYETGKALTFKLRNPDSTKIGSTSNFTLKGIGISSKGRYAFFGTAVTKDQVRDALFVTKRRQDELLNFIASYIGTAGQARAKDYARSSDYLMIKALFDSVRASSTDAVTPVRKTNALRNVVQAIDATKAINGTRFLDESEPYVYSLMYQMGAINENVFDVAMTFKSRPDRVPYKPLTDVQASRDGAAVITVRRIGRPSNDDREGQSVQKEIQRAEGILNSVTTAADINRKIAEYMLNTAKKSDPVKWKAYVSDKRLTLLGMQSLLIDLIYPLILAAMTQRAGSIINRKLQTGRSLSVGDAGARELGLADRDMLREVNNFRDTLLNELIKIKVPSNGTTDVDKYITELANRQLKTLTAGIKAGVEVISSSKTPSGKSYFSVESIVRMMVYGSLDFGRGQDKSTTTLLRDLIALYGELVEKGYDQAWVADKKNLNVVVNMVQVANSTTPSGNVTVQSPLMDRLVQVVFAAKETLTLLRAIRTATGNDFGLSEAKEIKRIPPIPRIALIEQYGISEPIMAAGAKKPRFQVVGSSAMTVIMDLQTDTENLFLGKLSVIRTEDIKIAEEGADALYNLIREPGEEVTAYNMLKSGRSLDRKRIINTNVPTVITGDVAASTLATDFRLVRRAVSIGLETEALASALGHSSSHIEVREPLLLALGMYRFVAKSTQIKSDDETQSWKMTLTLVPHEATYTTNRNLRRLNTGVTNDNLADIGSWVTASFDREQAHNISENAEKIKKVDPVALSVGAKVMGARVASSHYFAGLVVCHAIASAKRKLFSDSAFSYTTSSKNLNNMLAQETGPNPEIQKALNQSMQEKMALKVFVESAYTNALPAAGSGAIRSLTYPFTPELSLLAQAGGLVSPIAGGIAAEKAGAALGKVAWSSRFVGGTVKFLGKRGAPLVGDLAFILSDMYLSRTELQALGAGDNNSVIAADEEAMLVSLTEDFTFYAMNFLVEYAFAESKGVGKEFIEKIASEAQQTISAAGDFGSARTFGGSQKISDPNAIDINSQYFKATWPAPPSVRNITAAPKVALIVANFANTELVEASWEKGKKDIVNKYYEWITKAHKTSQIMSPMDICGEEVLELLRDGQLSMSRNTIPALMTIPGSIIQDIDFHYAMSRTIFGRLKLNIFAMGMLDQTFVKSKTVPFEMLGNALITKNQDNPAIIGLRGAGLSYDTKRKKLSFVADPNGLQRLAEGLITNRIPSGHFVAMPFPVLSKLVTTGYHIGVGSFGADVFFLTLQDSVKTCYQVCSSDTKAKIGALPNIAPLIEYAADGQLTIASYKSVVKASIQYLALGIGYVLQEANGLSADAYLSNDLVSILSNGVLEVLAKDKQKDLGIDEVEAIALIRSNPQLYDLSQGKNENTDQLRAALDRAVLYTTGDLKARQAAIGEYALFLSTIRSLVLQDMEPTEANDAPADGGDYKLFTTNGESLYKGGGGNILPFEKVAPSILGIRKTLRSGVVSAGVASSGSAVEGPWKTVHWQTPAVPVNTNVSGIVMPGSLFFLNRGKDAKSNFGNQSETIEMLSSMAFLFRASHGIVNPLFVPSVFMAGYIENKQMYLVKTPFTNATQAYMAIRKQPGWWTSFLSHAIRYITDENSIMMNVVFLVGAIIVAIFASAAIAAIAIEVAISTAVWALVGLLVKPAVAKLALGIQPWKMEPVGQLASPVPLSTMFMGAKILNDIAGSIHFVDIERITQWPIDPSRRITPPDVSDELFESGYILNDTLAYLTLPLLMRRNATHVRDIIPPGGFIVPDLSSFNTKAEALVDGLVANSFLFEDEYANLPQYMEQTARLAIETQAAGIVHEFGIPTSDADLKRYGSAREFMRCMSEMFISESGYGDRLAQSSDDLTIFGGMLMGVDYLHAMTVGRKLKAEGRDKDDEKLRAEYVAAIKEMKLGDFLVSPSPGRASTVAPNFQNQWILSTTTTTPTKGKPRLTGPFTRSTEIHAIDLSKEPKVFPVTTGDVELIGLERDQSANLFNRRTPFFMRHEISPEFSTTSSSKNPNRQGEIDKAAANLNDIQTRLTAAQVASNNSSKKKLPDLVIRQQEVQKLADEYAKAKQALDKLRNAPTPTEASFQQNLGIMVGFQGFNSAQMTYAMVAKQAAQTTSLFESRNLYNVLDNYSKTLSESSTEFRGRMQKIEEYLLKYAQNAIGVYSPDTIMIFDARGIYRTSSIGLGTLKDIPLLLALAIKQALDEAGGASSEDPLVLRMKHVVAAIILAADFLWYLNFLCSETEKQKNAVRDPKDADSFPTTAWLKDPGKVTLLKKVTDAADTQLSNAGGKANEVSSRYAARSAVASTYILGKIGAYLDPNSTSTVRGLKRVQDTTQEALMAPLQNYPVAKVYFVERNKGVTTMYDDLYGYADVMKVDIFDTWKDPESTAIVELSNTENKLDNIIRSRSQSENPFETRARNTDPLSGIMLKGGTRMQTYLGYGNVLSEEEQYLFEIGSVSKTPDNRTVIMGKGPGWVLKTPMGQRFNVPKEITFDNIKTVFRRQSGISSATGASPIPTELGDITEVLQESVPAVARSLIIYGLSVIGSADGFGRLGSKLPFGSDVMLARLPDSYSEQGLGESAITYIADLFRKFTYKTLFANLTIDDESSDVAATAVMNQTNSFEVNIKLSPFTGAASTSALTNIMSSLLTRLQDIAATVLLADAPSAIWRFRNENHFEFIKSVLMNVPNHRFYVRSYGTDGSMVIGTKDDYYSLFPPRSLESIMVQRYVEEQKVDLSLKAKSVQNIRRMANCFNNAASNINARRSVAELLSTTLATFAIASDSNKLVVQRILGQIAPVIGTTLAMISTNDGVFISDIRTLYDAMAESAETIDAVAAAIIQHTGMGVLEQLVSAAAKAANTAASTVDTIVAIYAAGIFPGIGPALGAAAKNVGIGEKVTADLYKRLREDSNATKAREEAAKKPVPNEKAGTRLGVMAAYITDNLPDYFKSAQALGSAGSMPVSFANFLPSAADGKDMAFLYTMIMVYHQMINVRVARLQALSPEMRPFYTEHRVFSEYDIVANNITTMIGYNEFNFTFEKASKFITKSRIPQIIATAGSTVLDTVKTALGQDEATLSTATESTVYSINPIAKRSGFDGYESVRQTIAIVNPDYFGRIQGMNFPAYLNTMAAEQMSEIVRDWYGGMLTMFGNAKRRPMDGMYIHDSISDMYGPADIKEIVHSFSPAGFMSTAAPSVSAHVDATSLGEAPALTAYRWTDAIIGIAIAGLTYKLGGRLVARGMRTIGAAGKLTRMAARLDRFARAGLTEAREAITSPGKISKVTRTIKNLPKLVAAAMIKTPFVGLSSVLKNFIDTNGREVLLKFAKSEAKNLRNAAAIVKTAEVFATPESQAALEYYKGLIKSKATIEAVTPTQLVNDITQLIGATNKTEILETATRAGLFQKSYGDKSYAKALAELETLLNQMEKSGAPIAKVKLALEKVNAIEAGIIRDRQALFQMAKAESQIQRFSIVGGDSVVTGIAGKQLHGDVVRIMAIGTSSAEIASASKAQMQAFVEATGKRVANPITDMSTTDAAFLKGKAWGTDAGDIGVRIEGFSIKITTPEGAEHANLGKVIFESEARALRELQAVEDQLAKGLSGLNQTTLQDLQNGIKEERKKILAAVEMRAKQLTDNGAVDGALVPAKVAEYQPFKVKNDVGTWIDDAIQTKSKNSVDNMVDSLQSQKITLDDLRGKVKPNQTVESLFVDNAMAERDKLLAGSKVSQDRISVVNEATKKLNDSMALKGDAVSDVIFTVGSDKAALQFAEDLRNPFFGNPAANPDARNVHGDILRHFLGILDGNNGGFSTKTQAYVDKVIEGTKKLSPLAGEAIELNAGLAARKIVESLEKDLAYQTHRASKIAGILADTKEALKQRPIPKQLEQILQEVAEAQRQSRQQILDQAKKAAKTAKNEGVNGAIKEFNAATAPKATAESIKNQITQDLDKLLTSPEIDEALLRYTSALVDAEIHTATQEAVIAFAQVRAKTAGANPAKLKSEFIAFVNTVNDVRAQGYMLSSSKGTPLKRSLILYGSVLGGYTAIKNLLGAPAEEYFARLASEQVAKAVRVSFLNVKGEPFVSNLEGLTKDAMIAIAGTESYGEVLKSRYFDFLTREGSSVLFETMDGLVKNTANAYFDLRAPISDATPLTDTLRFSAGLDDGTLANLRIADLVKDTAFGSPLGQPENRLIWGAFKTYGKPGTGAHTGLDIGATMNTPVLSIADGIVVSVQASLYPNDGSQKATHGRWVEVAHSVKMENVVDADLKSGTYNAVSRYAHLASVSVKVGDQVKRGQEIAKSGAAAKGSETAANEHLHISLTLARTDLPKGSVTKPGRLQPYKYSDLPEVNPAAYLVKTSPNGQVSSMFAGLATKGEVATITLAEALDKNRGY